MSGIYIHFPFCKQACHYCNFHFSTNTQFTESYLEALHQEITLRKGYLKDNIETIYLGGGTPSLMTIDALHGLFDQLKNEFQIEENAEVTLEANPDDLGSFRNEYLQLLKGTAVNRLSIGIQSFEEKDLRFMNRAHNSDEALSAIKNARQAGFKNITADLIYGTPTLSDQAWMSNLQKLIDLDIPHISAYALTVEERTALSSFIKKGTVEDIDDHKVADQFEMMVEILESNGFEHYEISNFAKPGHHSRHNTNYWKGVSYLGLGPSAHSYNGVERQWNIANTPRYIKGINEGNPSIEVETLSLNERYNEYVMTSLRTTWGVDLSHIETEFGVDLVQYFQESSMDYLSDMIIKNENIYTLTPKGKLYADRITSNLFKV